MDENALGFASYWRNSLADAESGKGSFERKDAKNFTHWHEIAAGRLDEAIVGKFFEGEKDDVETVDVILRPKVYFRLLQHGKDRSAGAPDIVTPIVTPALLSREGFLYPTPATSIPRDLLEPLPKGAFSIGEIEQYDKYKTTHTSFSINFDDSVDKTTETDEEREARYAAWQQDWRQYLDDSERLLKNVVGDWIKNPEQYELAEHGYIVKTAQSGGASFHILSLYDHLLVSKKDVPLFNRFASREIQAAESLLAPEAKFSDRLGHSGDKFPLAKAQRDALSHFLDAKHGDILAVNGPPGTGKTTLVLSIISTQWARAALEKAEPPVIIATSTNNQAVTNIIEAFGKDFSQGTGAMAGRWLPELKSFGAYFPSSTRKAEAAKKYQTEDFFNQVESKEYVEDALLFYLEKAKAAFPEKDCSSPEKVIELLHSQLAAKSEQLVRLNATWQTLSQVRAARELIANDIEQYLDNLNKLLSGQEQKVTLLKSAKTEWKKYRAGESLIYSLFSWLPAVRSKRQYQIQLFLEDKLGALIAGNQWSDPETIERNIDGLLNSAEREQTTYRQQIDSAHKIVLKEQQAAQEWQRLALDLGHESDEELSFSQADELADTQIRFPAFLLTTHYWEGRWLMDMASIDDLQKEKGKKGAKGVTARWQRRMKLTPCVVMTCYMLPGNMQISEHKGQRKFEKSYLYDFADLLIVDEAGQVLPEVAAASFALAKKALVIGDTEQIPPIWSIAPAIDIGNMLAEKILSGSTQEEITEKYTAIAELGKSAASGSVMKIAQCASRYQYDPELARGMYLYEHRRCFDDIIGYCNTLCYHGKLLPKRGCEESNLMPAMGYLHIDGKGELASSGSRYNLLEAETIAAWLTDNQQDIEAHYGKSLHEVVGIVTPFSAQVSTIKQALGKQGISTGANETSLTVGTVHSLQGAERAIVIFSPVYSKHEDGGFIDSDNSMLNVAVSRAKDSFLVFGDMDLFEIQPASSPRGLLAKYLFESEKNALTFDYKERKDLKTSETKIYTLHGVEQHDNFLNQTFENTGKHITIVSPWLTWQKLEQTGFLDSMIAACSRGITVTIVTDRSYNTEHNDFEKRKEKQQNLKAALEKLNALGIATKLVNRVHSKIVIGDDGLLCVGSFNWFSATREARYERYDTSMVYCGDNLKGEIEAIYNSLERRQV
ncbi:TPA: ATP-binding protein [Citrobacter freundii]|uniref:AAA domain-containing protein n=1 Tax=Citrobacter freundii TaxID=546 RepID=UPI000BCD7DFA|nr:AAA domain-containing protein [Citrobacter freundii]EKV0153581.1 ATP-binding protein [Citrobacter freundii]MBJ9131383.1 ATP-binding protein [Citrobacter freundii]PCQ47332.1 DNA helicase [Citrobacter freundii]HEJ0143922.1 ATP-binding protein [Citrobacter freundii]HEJ0145541.1 ATP-binding protein [Citrobacter freundii]